MTNKVLYIGDSRKTKGGVSAVIKTIQSSFVWEKFSCNWLECQINESLIHKLAYLLKALIIGLFVIPKYDIIHFHTSVGNSLKVQLPFFLYSIVLKKKIVTHFHVGNQLKKAAGNRLFSFYCRKSDIVLTLGESLKQYIPHDGKSRTRIECLYNPAPETTAKESSQKYFLAAIFIDSEMNKGYDTMLEAFSMISGSYPEWKMIICGDGDREKLSGLIEANKLTGKVITPGWVTGKEKDDLFRNAFAYCMASREEGLPITVLESIASGLPVISTPVGCVPELLSDGESALFFPTGDSRALADRMRMLIEDSQLYKRLSDNGKSIAQGKLSVNSFAAKLDNIYSAL